MKKTMIMVIIIMVLAICLPVFAQEFPDVPTDHWAYNSVQSLAEAGIIQGYPDGTFGGKRAMTRYEFAEALAKAIPVIASKVSGGTGTIGATGATGATGAKGDKGDKGDPGITPEQLAQIMKMSNEFRDELAALGVDVDQLKRDVADLQSRVSALELEQKRVVFSGDASIIARGNVLNSVDNVDGDIPTPTALDDFGVDRDGRALPGLSDNSNNPLASAAVYTDYAFTLKGRVGQNASVNAVISAGNYMSDFLGLTNDNFTLWNLNFNVTSKMGPLGKTNLTVGRFPFQLTPFTLKFVDPDTYATSVRTDNGDYIFDGAKAGFNIGKLGFSVFAAKTAPENEFGTLISPNLMTAGAAEATVGQLAGVRAVVGAPYKGKLGLTYYQTGQQFIDGRAQIYGADYMGSISKFDIGAEYAKSTPDDALEAAVFGNGADLGDNNSAFKAKLGYNFGKLGISGGYIRVEPNFFAPGDWSRAGMAVNFVNVEGLTADVKLALTKKFKITGSAMFLNPDKDTADTRARMAIFQNGGPSVDGNDLDKINTWKACLNYGISSASSIDLGYEEVRWTPIVSASDDVERYYTIGVGHTFNTNSSLKLMYQIIDYKSGFLDPYNLDGFRGGVATAQFQFKY